MNILEARKFFINFLIYIYFSICKPIWSHQTKLFLLIRFQRAILRFQKYFHIHFIFSSFFLYFLLFFFRFLKIFAYFPLFDIFEYISIYSHLCIYLIIFIRKSKKSFFFLILKWLFFPHEKIFLNKLEKKNFFKFFSKLQIKNFHYWWNLVFFRKKI